MQSHKLFNTNKNNELSERMAPTLNDTAINIINEFVDVKIAPFIYTLLNNFESSPKRKQLRITAINLIDMAASLDEQNSKKKLESLLNKYYPKLFVIQKTILEIYDCCHGVINKDSALQYAADNRISNMNIEWSGNSKQTTIGQQLSIAIKAYLRGHFPTEMTSVSVNNPNQRSPKQQSPKQRFHN